MKINQLTYYDHKREWQLQPMQFSDFNLLVGASGVGKSQIINSVINLQRIAKGESFNGVSWDIYFTISDNYQCQWKGEFENVKSLDYLKLNNQELISPKQNKFKIIRENLYINGESIIERDNQSIRFKNQELPKLPSEESVVWILREEKDIALIQKGFIQIKDDIDPDIAWRIRRPLQSIYFKLGKTSFTQELQVKYPILDLANLKEINLHIQDKLILLYENFPLIFNQIKQDFIEIFPYVEDIKLEVDIEETNPSLKDYPMVKFKEKGVNNWIKENEISSGMLKTLIHISEIYLSAEGTVILIDEFENSLGVNCIDILTELLIKNRQLQFIITSHHPYIINKIGMEHWKIITRKGGVVIAREAKDFHLGASRHQAFMQLINLDAYKEGITVE